MMEITVVRKEGKATGWVFEVILSGSGKSVMERVPPLQEVEASFHTVSLEKAYYERLTQGSVTPERLVEISFKFLLERESKESILRHFDLPRIGSYFPEYEREIKSRLK